MTLDDLRTLLVHAAQATNPVDKAARLRKFALAAEQMALEVAASADDDLDDPLPEKACSLDDGPCESCQ